VSVDPHESHILLVISATGSLLQGHYGSGCGEVREHGFPGDQLVALLPFDRQAQVYLGGFRVGVSQHGRHPHQCPVVSLVAEPVEQGTGTAAAQGVKATAVWVHADATHRPLHHFVRFPHRCVGA